MQKQSIYLLHHLTGYFVVGGLMFLPNLSGALSNIHKTLVSDGYLAAAVWATPFATH